jgi:hypothetical protein
MPKGRKPGFVHDEKTKQKISATHVERSRLAAIGKAALVLAEEMGGLGKVIDAGTLAERG